MAKQRTTRAEAAKKAWEHWRPIVEGFNSEAAEMRLARDRIYREIFPEHNEAMAAAGGWGSPGGAKRVLAEADCKWQKLTELPVLCNADAWRTAACTAGYRPAEADSVTLSDIENAVRAWAVSLVAEQRRAVKTPIAPPAPVKPHKPPRAVSLTPEDNTIHDPEDNLVLAMKGNSRVLLLYLWKRGNVPLDELQVALHAERRKKNPKAKAPSDKAVNDAVEYLKTKLSEARFLHTKVKKNGGMFCLHHPQK